jgi:hypothetical protein
VDGNPSTHRAVGEELRDHGLLVRRTALVIGVGLTLASTVPGSSSSREFNTESWPTVSLGWRTDGGNLFSSENGGRTWHRIFPRKIEILSVARTSRTAGVFGNFRRRYWTSDNGRHWHLTRRISPEFDGRGKWLFYVGGQRRTKLYRVSPWPPRTGTIRSRLLATTSVGSFAQIEAVPGGVVAAIDIGPEAPHRPKVLIRRNGTQRVVQLPLPSGRPEGTCNVLSLTAEWPNLWVLGQPREIDGKCSADLENAMTWWSPDGGQTWWIA